MKTYSRLIAHELTQQLINDDFLTTDADDASIAHPAPPGLLIRQVGEFIVNSAFDLNCGQGTGFMLELHVAVDLPEFAISDWKLEVPWQDPRIVWLPEPEGLVYPDNVYRFRGRRELEYPKGEVINHRRKLRRGYGLDGLLLGYSPAPIADSYPNGTTVDANLVLIDEMWHEFATPVQLWLNRSAKVVRKPAKPKTRQPIFENHDYAEEERVQK